MQVHPTASAHNLMWPGLRSTQRLGGWNTAGATHKNHLRTTKLQLASEMRWEHWGYTVGNSYKRHARTEHDRIDAPRHVAAN
jgi:hypothetical protein